MQCRAVVKANAHEWQLSNGSVALAFPTTGGRSYTATLAIVDEADYVPDLDALLSAVKPTIDAGGRMVLLSTVDKASPESAFKRIYWSGVRGGSSWRSLFLPWSARPDRTAEWYEMQKADVLARTGFLDDLYQEYPATDLEAVAPRSADVRFSVAWLEGCRQTFEPPGSPGPALPGLECFEMPAVGKFYVIGADPAEGNPQSDESAATVMELGTGAEVASLAGRFDPAVFGAHLDTLSTFYNSAPVLVERNNHGHAVLLWLQENSAAYLLAGLDDKPGWLTTAKSKTLAFDYAAERMRSGDCVIRGSETLRQLQGLQGSDLRAPDGQHDDRAVSFVLALNACKIVGPGSGRSAMVVPVDVIADADSASW
jgi:hypothetical protein